MTSSPMLGNSELAQPLASAGDSYPAAQAHTKIKVEDERGNGDDHSPNHIEDDGEYSRDMSLETTDDDNADDSNDHNDDCNDGDQLPAAPNGTYSESLTRLQNGYLHAISTLEYRNNALQYELNDLRSRHDQVNIPLTRRLAYEEQRNVKLEAELRAARLWPPTHKKTLRDLELTLAKKNATIKEKNSKINEVEAKNSRLVQELRSEKKKNKELGATIEMQNKAHVASRRSDGTVEGMMTLPIRQGTSTVKMEDTTNPAMKKRKFHECVSGGSDNPVVLD